MNCPNCGYCHACGRSNYYQPHGLQPHYPPHLQIWWNAPAGDAAAQPQTVWNGTTQWLGQNNAGCNPMQLQGWQVIS